jgi:hypothetical protein
MSSYRFSQLANRVIPLKSGPQISVSATVDPPAQIVYQEQASMIGRGVQSGLQSVGQISSRAISGIPTNAGKTPPPLEQFDPLNPGEWQLGAGGKLLPRLPEGTRVGKLVMGKYGLYDPKLRKRVEAYSAGLDAGKKSEAATPFDATLTNIAKALAFFCLGLGFYNAACITYGKEFIPLGKKQQ